MRYLSILFIIALVSSCVPKKKIIYFQDIPKQVDLNHQYKTTLKPNDVIHLQIKTPDTQSSEIFNLTSGLVFSPPGVLIGHLVDAEYNIDFPVIGKVNVKDMSITDLKLLLTDKLKKENHLIDFFIDVRYANFKVNVIGEVNQPGEVNVFDERITLIEAISRRGDLSIFADRKNIVILREENNQIKTYHVDFTKSDFINSEFYYLQQNDVVYVYPRRAKADNTAISSNITTSLAIISSLLTIYLLINR